MISIGGVDRNFVFPLFMGPPERHRIFGHRIDLALTKFNIYALKIDYFGVI